MDGEGSKSLIPESIKAETLASHVKLRSLINDVVLANSITPLQTTIPQFTDTAGSSAAATFAVEHLDIITNSVRGDSTGADLPSVTIASINSNVITTTASHGLQAGDAFIPLETSNNLVKDTKYFIISTPAANTLTVSETYGGSVFTLTNGSGLSVPVHVEDNPAATDGVSSTTALITAAETLDAQQEALVTLVNTYIDTNYPTLTYNEEKCKRDTRLILEAVMWDFQLNTNFNTLIAAQAYLRSSSSEVFSLNKSRQLELHSNI